MSQRNRFFAFLGLLLIAAAIYYIFSADHSSDLVLIGTVDANQVVVSPKIMGRIERLAVDEGTEVKAGQTVAVLDSQELSADRQAAEALLASLRHQVSQTRATEEQTAGETSSGVVNAQARLRAAQATLAQANADLQRIESDTRRAVALAQQGVASQQQADQAQAQLKAQQAFVRAAEDQINAAKADLETAQARTHQAHAAESTVAATRAQELNAQAQLEAAEARLGYTRITSPVSGTVTVRAALEGEVVNPGTPIVIITDLSDTWIRAAIPETEASNIALGDHFQVRLPSGETIPGKVIFKAPEADFATQRDVNRRKRDIKTIALKLAVDNKNRNLVPGMTADVLVPKSKLGGS
ncbi:MAG TPA: efflux RND transporter periplasmic adaptor subunit [Candidatus Limnocylindrales bacterium]|nr:efflux RND transporter periplasmic adaptor subunit [Candidatus Limnocylindrales bacterium]